MEYQLLKAKINFLPNNRKTFSLLDNLKYKASQQTNVNELGDSY